MATTLPAGLAAIGAEVDHPVGRGDDIEVVLDDHHGIAHVNQAIEDGQQAVDVGEMKTRRRLIQDVEASAAGHPAKLRRELDSLGLTAGERGARLAEREIAERPRRAGRQDPGSTRGWASKNARASSTRSSRTSPIDLPLNRISSV